MEHCETDKIEWVKRHLGENVHVIVSSDKSAFADGASVLIDDQDKNILPWVAAGGIAIKHSSTDDTINRLEEIFHEGYKPSEISPIEELEK